MMTTPVVDKLSKEAFIFETVLELIRAKELEYKFGYSHGVTISGVGRERARGFKISRKTKWESFKTLEEEGYIRHVGHPKGKDYCLTDEAWEPIKQAIIKFLLVNREKAAPPAS
jgi:hypothetical protein